MFPLTLFHISVTIKNHFLVNLILNIFYLFYLTTRYSIHFYFRYRIWWTVEVCWWLFQGKLCGMDTTLEHCYCHCSVCVTSGLDPSILWAQTCHLIGDTSFASQICHILLVSSYFQNHEMGLTS